ncbi:MAG: RNA polymerase sigma factor [Bdellovibrionales bacterium]|nr:RNA polymerase sigma factor [Bdellovibrionales bacterium]
MRKSWLVTIWLLVGVCPQLCGLGRPIPKPCADHAEAEAQSLEWMMQQVLLGREEIWDSLIPRLIPPLTRYFERRGPHVRGHADDLIQITLVRLYEKASLYDVNKRVLPWIYRIAHNEMTSWIRHGNRQRQVQPQYIDESYLMHYSTDGRNGDDEYTLFLSRREDILNILPRLSTQRRREVIALVLQGFNDTEIGERLNIPRPTVAWHRSAATKEILEILQP